MSPSEAASGVQKEVLQIFALVKEKKFKEAERLFDQSLTKTEDPGEQAVLYSAKGILEKFRGDFKAAWRAYEKAEKLLPGDPSLKVISARLLIDEFAQHETAIKKLKKVLKLTEGVPSFQHHAYTLMGLAYLKKGEKKKAAEMLEKSMAGGFEGMASAENVDFSLVEACLRRNFEREKCQEFAEKALRLAEEKKDQKIMFLIHQLLESFEVTERGSAVIPS